jgi:putative DNA primase/helicase
MNNNEAFAPRSAALPSHSRRIVEDEKFDPLPPPRALDQDEIHHGKLGRPSRVWSYYDADGGFSGHICRFETGRQNGNADKEFRPYRHGILTKNGKARTGWHWKGWGQARPLYNLPELLTRPDARVIVVEGEKKVDAARRLFPDCVPVSPMNGARSLHKTDWTPLAGRTVTIWPDNDPTSRDFFAAKATKLAFTAGAADVAVVAVPQQWPEKWDLADSLPDGVHVGTLTDLLNSAKQCGSSPDRRTKEPASEEDITGEVQQLAAASPVRYELKREAVAKKLGIRVGVLDRLVNRGRGAGNGGDPLNPGQGRPVEIPEIEPWPDPVEGTGLLTEVAQSIREYVVLSPRQVDAVALWVFFTHAFDAFDFSPKLVINSPEKRSGKTRLVEVAERLVRRPLFVSGISPAALLRVIEHHAPSMLIDEIDALMKGDAEMAETLRGVINSSFSRAGARFIKNVPSPDGGFEPRAFSTWCPMLLAGIGKLPDTVADRSIIIGMTRKRVDEKVKRLRTRDGGELHGLARKAARWVADHFDAIKLADPSAPEALHDRAADAWSPLLAIADAIGGEWPTRARKAAIELSGGEGFETIGEMLLNDIRAAFDARTTDRLTSDALVSYLAGLDDRPWCEVNRGNPLTKAGLAKRLKPFKIKPGSIRLDDCRTLKGYYLSAFEDVFARYLPSLRYQTVTTSQARQSAGLSENQGVTSGHCVTFQDHEIPSVYAGCDAVTFRNPLWSRDDSSEWRTPDPGEAVWTE